MFHILHSSLLYILGHWSNTEFLGENQEDDFYATSTYAIYAMQCYTIYKVKLATIVEGDPKAPFSIATTPRCREGRYSFPWIAPLYP